MAKEVDIDPWRVCVNTNGNATIVVESGGFVAAAHHTPACQVTDSKTMCRFCLH